MTLLLKSNQLRLNNVTYPKSLTDIAWTMLLFKVTLPSSDYKIMKICRKVYNEWQVLVNKIGHLIFRETLFWIYEMLFLGILCNIFRWQLKGQYERDVILVYGCFTHLRIVHCNVYLPERLVTNMIDPPHEMTTGGHTISPPGASTLIHAVVASIWGVRLGWLGRMHPHWSMMLWHPYWGLG